MLWRQNYGVEEAKFQESGGQRKECGRPECALIAYAGYCSGVVSQDLNTLVVKKGKEVLKREKDCLKLQEIDGRLPEVSGPSS